MSAHRRESVPLEAQRRLVATCSLQELQRLLFILTVSPMAGFPRPWQQQLKAA